MGLDSMVDTVYSARSEAASCKEGMLRAGFKAKVMQGAVYRLQQEMHTDEIPLAVPWRAKHP
jgi:hypothetical protein